MKKILIYILLFYLCTGIRNLYAQKVTDLFYENNLWLSGSNPAGLIYNPKILWSDATINYEYVQGNFRLNTDAPTIHSYAVSSESFYPWKNIQLYGRIQYSGQYDKDRQWNATLQPENHLIIFGDTISGLQIRETYNICGGIGIPLNEHWSIGGLVNFYARSNIKKTNPRNQNKQNDLYLSPGLIYRQKKFHTGLNFMYRKNTEDISYTNTDPEKQEARTYFPLWFYLVENISGTSYNFQRIYQDKQYGIGWQFYFTSSRWKWFCEFRYLQGNEITDISKTYGIRAGETLHRLYNYQGILSLQTQVKHVWTSGYQRDERTHSDNIQFQSDGSLKVENLGKAKRSAIFKDKLFLEYKLSKPHNPLYDRWSIYGSLCYEHEKTFFMIYPARYLQPITQYHFKLGYTYRFIKPQYQLKISPQLTYSTGHGSLPRLSLSSQAPQPEIKMAQKQDLLIRDFQFKTSETITMGVFLQYIRNLTTHYALLCQAGADYKQPLASGNRHLLRLNLSVSTGIIF